MKIPAIIVDIDGTLADCEHRRIAAMQSGGMNWKVFFENMENDGINYWCKQICEKMYTHYQIILVTGRDKKHYKTTMDWLKDHEVKYSRLMMREDGDYRPDTVVKKEIYEKHIRPTYQVLFCVDDRKSVVEMWRSLGLVCLQCDEGNF